MTISRLIKVLGMLSMSLCISSQAMAIVEMDVGYAGIISSNGANSPISGATYSGAYGLEADLRFMMPVIGLNFGARYTNLGLTLASGGQTITIANSAVSGVVGYRFIDTLILFGPVFSYALTNSGTFSYSGSGVSASSTAGTVTQNTAGIEIGLKTPIVLAGEFGYGNLQMSNFSNTSTLNLTGTSVSMSGPYAQVHVGFNF
jgi:hypothetical protein